MRGRRFVFLPLATNYCSQWFRKKTSLATMFLKELISQGWQALMRDRLRSTLTMLGIVWGLASVVLLLAYGQGLGGSVLHAFLNMGSNVIVLWPGQTSMQAGGQRAGKTVK